jgi:adenosylhomocysteine nucleosidase
VTFVGVVVSAAPEARCLTRHFIPKGGFVCLSEGMAIRLCGPGPEASGPAAEELVKRGATALLSWGTAGGLDPVIPSGGLIIPETILVPENNSLAVDRTWHQAVCGLLRGKLEFHTGPLVQSSSLLRAPVEKRALYERSGAVAVDMESGVIASVARRAGTPFLCVRAVADTASMTVPLSALAALDESGRVRPLRMLIRLSMRPRDFYPLLSLGRGFRDARKSLISLLLLAGGPLGAPRGSSRP